jgi:hypothetical protein
VKISAGKPNIIVILTDDQTYRGIGYNNPEVKTPNLDALAASGITFEHGYVASPICAASRASLMTGRFPQQHGVIRASIRPSVVSWGNHPRRKISRLTTTESSRIGCNIMDSLKDRNVWCSVEVRMREVDGYRLWGGP